MLNARSFSVLCIVTLAVSVAAVFVGEESGAIPGSGKPLFPELMSRINEIEVIEVQNAEQNFVLERQDTGWVVPGKSGYPADGDKVHRLLVGAAGLTRVEPKTSKPELYARLGLEDPGREGSTAVAYRLKGAGGTTFASLIVGNSAPAKGDPDLSEFYVRVPHEPRSWLVEGKLPRSESQIDWTARKVIDIDRDRVQEVRVTHRSGEEVVVYREAPAQKDFTLEDLAAGMSVDGQWKLNDIGRLLADLEFDDVQLKRGADLGDEFSYAVRMQTFDGLEVRMQVYEIDGEPIGVLSASFEPQAVTQPGPEQPPLRDPEGVRAEVGTLNARWDEWVYVLPDYKFDALKRTREELVKVASDNEPSSAGG